jgi:hypothetical protein
VAGVAITATRRERVAATAGLIPGSTPTNASAGQRARSAAIASTVAVLQATTISRAPCPARCSTMRSLRAITWAALRCP